MKLFLISFLFPLIVSAQDTVFENESKSYESFFNAFRSDSTISFRSRKGYVPTLIHNLGYQATFPLRLKGKDFIYPAATVVGTVLLLNYDEEIDITFKTVKNKNRFIHNVSPHYTELGDYYGYILLAGIGGFSMASHNYRLFRTSLMASQAAITAGLWIRVGKIFSGRMRPEAIYVDKEFHSDHWFGPFAQFNKNNSRGVAAFDAFPSGHTGAAFAIATAFSMEYHDYKAIPVTLYSVAGIIGVTRLIEHTHWASDVFLGGIIGYYCGKQVYENEKRLFPNYRKTKKSFSSVYPFENNGAYGLTWKIIY